MAKKTMVIGLDGASWTILNTMIAHGHMPTLQAEIENGRAQVLTSTEPPITPSAWTSFQTGLSPEDHHVLGFKELQMKDGRFQSNILFSTNLSVKRIWDILSEHKKRVCILNLPLTYPPFPINGILVSGFPVPSSKTEFTFPEEFKSELFEKIPDFEVMQSGIGASEMGMKIEDMVSRWMKTMSQKTRLARYLLEKEPWDVFMVHIQETDVVQHYLWHCIDPSDPQHTVEDFDKVAKFYANLDKDLSVLIKKGREKGFSIIILSDHGFQRCIYNIKINNWLFKKGYLVLNKDIKRLLISCIKKVFDLPLLYKYRSSIKYSRKSENATNQFLNSVINYEKSTVFVETNATNIAFAHFINNSEEVVKKVLGEIELILDPEGQRIVNEISKVEGRGNAVYKIVFSNGIKAIGTIPSGKSFIEPPIVLKQQVGMHHKDGIIIMDKSLDDFEMPANIFSVPNTIMDLQDIAFDPMPKKECSDLFSAANFTPQPEKAESEKSEIEDQLKSLGYL
ncbi:alkaline phosphatase family protein [Desulforhabdus amnigena]|jgi:predicted AlkP superfamily phosphohydrolase/phosphomutase|uniref:Nucleotide pyrophosphatase n=1 Tax=Desulforhabdus amnigena TaxID=40218 RepID=A0A9W6D2I4_9BACT|nr:alkaline phosphatase family protein [Desulforhabdus amnigena]GLI33413.1 nucleotide pyrophosphatase [Desulforhabdus amnigena]